MYPDRLSFHVSFNPFYISWLSRGLWLQLHHLPPIIKLLPRLQIIPSISPHEPLVFCGQTNSIWPRESRDILNPLITRSEILTHMGIHMKQEISVETESFCLFSKWLELGGAFWCRLCLFSLHYRIFFG